MDMKKMTKAELIAELTARNAECMALRERVSVLEGEKALRPAPGAERIVTVGGVPCRRVVERLGQCTRTRYVPVATN